MRWYEITLVILFVLVECLWPDPSGRWRTRRRLS